MITHRIGADVCLARQQTFFHKCHRCVYRGQAADWQPPEAHLEMINVHTAEEPVQAGVKIVKMPGKGGKPEPKQARQPAPAARSAAAGG
ncbi:MAG: hypothetical protein JNM25_11455 [Planctomycetes bacterium]|nr:hypothetical protein [Planctomycetota bacterium]